MADRPKVSRVTVKVPGVDPGLPGSKPGKITVCIELAEGSIPLTEKDELVLYLNSSVNGGKIFEFPRVGNGRLTWCQSSNSSCTQYCFEADPPFVPANTGEGYAYTYRKITYNTAGPHADWPELEYEGGSTGFAIESTPSTS